MNNIIILIMCSLSVFSFITYIYINQQNLRRNKNILLESVNQMKRELIEDLKKLDVDELSRTQAGRELISIIQGVSHENRMPNGSARPSHEHQVYIIPGKSVHNIALNSYIRTSEFSSLQFTGRYRRTIIIFIGIIIVIIIVLYHLLFLSRYSSLNGSASSISSTSLPLIALTATPIDCDIQVYVDTRSGVSGLNIRDKPAGVILISIPNGSTVFLLCDLPIEKSSQIWVKVRYDKSINNIADNLSNSIVEGRVSRQFLRH